MGLLWVWLRTFSPRELGLWVLPGTHQSPSLKLKTQTMLTRSQLVLARIHQTVNFLSDLNVQTTLEIDVELMLTECTCAHWDV